MDRYQVALINSPGDQVPFVVAFRTTGRISLPDAVKVHADAMTRRGIVLVAGTDHGVASTLPRPSPTRASRSWATPRTTEATEAPEAAA